MKESFKVIIHSLKELISNGIVEHVKQSTIEIKEAVEVELETMMKHFFQLLISVSIIITGLIFFAIGMVLFVQDAFNLTTTQTYLISGIGLILIALWYQKNMSTKYKYEKLERRSKK